MCLSTIEEHLQIAVTLADVAVSALTRVKEAPTSVGVSCVKLLVAIHCLVED